MTQTTPLALRRRTASELPAIEPAVDILERSGDIVLTIDLPGCAEADVEVTVEKDSIRIEATPDLPPEVENGPTYREFLPARFSRTFSLSREADRDSIEATLDRGVLRLSIPHSKTGLDRKIQVRPRTN
jgi:HSP20 family molecular chaperone IbpA